MPSAQSQQSASISVASMKHAPVERVIQAMHANLEEPFGLSSMAKIAYLSRFHFNRTFRRVTGIPPTRFLYALRIATARRLLLQTQMRVIDICYEVGYNSLGTFTRRFTELLGVSPTRFRVMARFSKCIRIDPGNGIESVRCPCQTGSKQLSGRVYAPPGFRGLILIGLFDSAIPQGRPRACAMVAEAGPFEIVNPPDGSYYLLALALFGGTDVLAMLECESALRAGGQRISIQDGTHRGDTNLHLRPKSETDPPILLTIPLLLGQLVDQPLKERAQALAAQGS